MGKRPGKDSGAHRNPDGGTYHLLDGGFYSEKPLPGPDQADFAPHGKAPTLIPTG